MKHSLVRLNKFNLIKNLKAQTKRDSIVNLYIVNMFCDFKGNKVQRNQFYHRLIDKTESKFLPHLINVITKQHSSTCYTSVFLLVSIIKLEMSGGNWLLNLKQAFLKTL